MLEKIAAAYGTCLTRAAYHDFLLALNMAENPKDRSRINVSDPSEVAYWCQKLGCSETQLRYAIKTVGVTVSKVRAHLNQRK